MAHIRNVIAYHPSGAAHIGTPLADIGSCQRKKVCRITQDEFYGRRAMAGSPFLLLAVDTC